MTPTTDEVRYFGDARRGLQGILHCLLFLWAIIAIPLIVQAGSLPTVPKWPWIGDFVAAIAPGLPPRLARLATTYFWQTALMLGLVWALRRGMARLAQAQAEVILQRSIRNSAYRVLWRVKFAVAVAKLRWLAVFLLLAALLFISLDVWAGLKSGVELAEKPTQEITAVGCSHVRGNCRLAEGESVRIAIRSDRTNDTGIWLEAGAIYTSRVLEHSQWTDNGILSPAWGFHFGLNALGIRRFWWAECLRPLPDGRWFQLLGRVDRKKPMLRVLGDYPKEPHAWAPQHSGELVLMVNDVILRNNTGSMTLELERVPTSSIGN